MAGAGVFSAAAQQSPPVRGEEIVGNSPERKSPGRAFLYSLGGTVGLMPVYGLGLFVGPSFGHFYAGNTRQAWLGIGIRGGLGLGTLYLGYEHGPGWIGVGVLTIVLHAAYDVLTAPQSAQEFNDRLEDRVRMTPTSNSRSGQVGLSVQVQL